MSTLSTGELAAIIGGRLRLGSMPPLGGDLEPIGRLAIDSRTVAAGELFWGLATPPDAANLPEEAFARGAQGVVVAGRRVAPWAGTFSIEVDDAKWALWQLARTMRSRFEGRVIAVAGDLGKTTTRAMIETVLCGQFAGFHGDDQQQHRERLRVGLPLVLSQLDDDEYDYAVVELHGRDPRELAAEVQLCRPDIFVLTPSAEDGAAHRGAYRELLEALPPECLVVASGDDRRWERALNSIHTNTMWVGRGADCDLAADRVRLGGGRLQLFLEGRPVRVPVWGRHHLSSVLAALAVARLMGLDVEQASSALTEFAPPAGCCSVIEESGVTVVDDTRCTSATAARSVIHALRDAARTGRRLLVLGELPAHHNLPLHEIEAKYRLLGATAVGQCGADGLIACGAGARQAVDAARQAGMPHAAAVACGQTTDIAPLAARAARPGDTVLVVGGLGEALPEIVAKIAAAQQTSTEKPTKSTTMPQSSKLTFEVPPLASALREADAALPPGLEH
ncbi:MAG: Mur ligase family protein [Pirellulaceae bacterium]